MEGRKGEPSKELYPYTYAERALIDVKITDRAVDYIAKEAKGSKPFFLYIPFTLPHNPPVPAPEFVVPADLNTRMCWRRSMPMLAG